MYAKKLKEFFDIEKLNNMVINGCNNIKNNIDLYDHEDGRKIVIIDIIIDNHYGQYIPQNLCEFLNIEKCINPYDEFYWEDFEDIENGINNIVNDIANIPNGYMLYFGHNECCDYCLFLTEKN